MSNRDDNGAPIPVHSAAKTVADCFKFRSKNGLDVALEALKDFWRSSKVTMAELSHFAIINRVGGVMQPSPEGCHPMPGNRSVSILARLMTLAKQRGDDYSLLHNRFGTAPAGPHQPLPAADRFLLKGALLFAHWYDTPHRPTRDADMLGFSPDDEANLIATFGEIAAMGLDDGIVFDPDSVKADAIREDNTYGGRASRWWHASDPHAAPCRSTWASGTP